MDRRRFFGALGAASLGAREERRPNLLVVIANGWRGQALPFGGGEVKAAAIRRLAAGGVQLSRAYTPNPEAEPALTAIQTGRYSHLAGRNPLEESFPGAGVTVDTIEDAIRVIRDRDGEHPFRLRVVTGQPATGAIAQSLVESYLERKFRLRLNVPAEMAGYVRRPLAEYYARCSNLDAGIGRILSALDATEIAADTIFVVTSTHGSMLGSHGLQGGGEHYEESVRVPLLIRYPRRVVAARTIDMPVSTIDLAPTLLSLARVDIPDGLQGLSLSPWLLGGGGPRSESVYCQGRLGREQEWRMVVRGLDKVVVNRDLEITHLYNLGQDPFELDNLADEKSAARKRDEMTAILRDWMRRASDRFLPSGLKLRD